MKDMILLVEDFVQFTEFVSLNYPAMLARDAENNLISPPEITGVLRTPAVISGTSLMVYARVPEDQEYQWRDNPHVEVLAETDFEGDGTAEVLISKIEADPALLEKYESVYSRAWVTRMDQDGNQYQTRPSRLFGTLAGAGGAPWSSNEQDTP